MAKAIKAYAGGIQNLVHAAVRADGALFKRYQDKTPYGYRWGAWKHAGTVDVNNLPLTIPSGFSNLYPTDRNFRLPNN